MESCFSTIKTELADRFGSCSEAKRELFAYIEVFLTNGVGIRRSARSVRQRTSGARGQRAWTSWKTAQDAVSHRAHTRHSCLNTRNEQQLKQRS
jgi:hypothetical protein